MRRWLALPDIVILAAVAMHVFEGLLLLLDIRGADWTFPFQAFLAASLHIRALAGGVVLAGAIMAIIAELIPGISEGARFILLMGQMALLCLVSLWSMAAVIHAIDAFGHPSDPVGLLVNQFHRILMPIAYAFAATAKLHNVSKRLVFDDHH